MNVAERMIVAGLAALLPQVPGLEEAKGIPQAESTRVRGGHAPGGGGAGEAEELLVGVAAVKGLGVPPAGVNEGGEVKNGEGEAVELVVPEHADEAVGLLRIRKVTVTG